MTSVTFLNNPVTLIGKEVKVGDQAPSFTVIANDLTPVTIESAEGKVRLISVIPSIDTGICDQQTRQFNEQLSNYTNVEVLTISVDLPFAQKKWCGASGLSNINIYSDHKDLSFGKAYGVYMEEYRLLARAVFVVDMNNKVTYVEYVSEGTNHSNYEAAFEAVTKLV
jgi:thiol peroxidase